MNNPFDKLYGWLLETDEYIVRSEKQGNIIKIITNTDNKYAPHSADMIFVLAPGISYWCPSSKDK